MIFYAINLAIINVRTGEGCDFAALERLPFINKFIPPMHFRFSRRRFAIIGNVFHITANLDHKSALR